MQLLEWILVVLVDDPLKPQLLLYDSFSQCSIHWQFPQHANKGKACAGSPTAASHLAMLTLMFAEQNKQWS